MEVTIELWGDFACFAPPYGKVERLTYPVPTPSAARGILSAVYMKPKEFIWEVRRIEVMNPSRYISFKRNEVKVKVSDTPIYADDERTQRQTVALQDVRYRITARIVPRKEFEGNVTQLYEQAMRRIRSGKCFHQPCLGQREFVAYFAECTEPADPIDESMDLGWMVYDVFDLNDYAVTKKAKPKLALYHAVMDHGVIEVPPYDSPEIIRGGGE